MEKYRSLLLSMTEDARVILIKLAERLHNMRTLKQLLAGKQKRIALSRRPPPPEEEPPDLPPG